jgi:hypothetical protein
MKIKENAMMMCCLLGFVFHGYAFGDIYALHEVHHTGMRLAAQVALETYEPVYQLVISARAGDILRLAGQIEVTEEKERQNKVWAYLSVRPWSSLSRIRASSYGWQKVKRGYNNHHMPLHLFGHYEVGSDGVYVVELMARLWFTTMSEVSIERALRCSSERRNNPEYRDCDWLRDADVSPRNPAAVDSGQYGQIIVEQYRAYSSAQAAIDAGARLVADSDRAPFEEAGVRVIGERDREATELPRTKSFSLAPGDILRIQSAAAQLSGDIELFALELRVGNDDDSANDLSRRLSVSTENIVPTLSRITLQNDGVYPNTSSNEANVYAFQRTNALLGRELRIPGRSTDVVALHFANMLDGAYLAGSDHLTTPRDLTFSTTEPVMELFAFSGQHQEGDILRVHSQLQLEMIGGSVGAACWARVEIWENGVRRYDSIYDQRYVRNSTEVDKDHDSATFAPFALYKTQQAGEHRVRLIADCNASSAATMSASHYGRHLTVDRFTVDSFPSRFLPRNREVAPTGSLHVQPILRHE